MLGGPSSAEAVVPNAQAAISATSTVAVAFGNSRTGIPRP